MCYIFLLPDLELTNWLCLDIIVHPSPPPRAACWNLSELIKSAPFPSACNSDSRSRAGMQQLLRCAPLPPPDIASPAEWCSSRLTLSKRLLSRYRTCSFGTCHQIYTSETKCGSQTKITNFYRKKRKILTLCCPHPTTSASAPTKLAW
jgi:hypothetical protein